MNLDEAKDRLLAKMKAAPSASKAISSRPETLYHYTSAEGLLGIVSSNVLRASSALYMNDASELEYARDLIQKIIAAKIGLWARNRQDIDFMRLTGKRPIRFSWRPCAEL